MSDIRQAYLNLAKVYHPDKVAKIDGETDEDFEKRKAVHQERFKKLQSAYERLFKDIQI